jgi:hypothetical protein
MDGLVLLLFYFGISSGPQLPSCISQWIPCKGKSPCNCLNVFFFTYICIFSGTLDRTNLHLHEWKQFEEIRIRHSRLKSIVCGICVYEDMKI